MRFLLIDDHPVVRFGLKKILKDSFPNLINDEASCPITTIKKLAENEYDLIILDTTLPNMGLFQLMDHILALNQNNKVLLFSMVSNYNIIKRFTKKGARGCICKSYTSAEIIYAVKKILSGKRYFVLIDTMINKNHFEGHPFDILTPRELQITTHLLEGHGTSSISSLLNIKTSTTSTHKGKILSKLGISNIAQLVELSKSYNFNKS